LQRVGRSPGTARKGSNSRAKTTGAKALRNRIALLPPEAPSAPPCRLPYARTDIFPSENTFSKTRKQSEKRGDGLRDSEKTCNVRILSEMLKKHLYFTEEINIPDVKKIMRSWLYKIITK
jgi:hypothetical protein